MIASETFPSISTERAAMPARIAPTSGAGMTRWSRSAKRLISSPTRGTPKVDEVQLARILEETVRDAEERGDGTMTRSICLFGIRYAEEICGCDTTAHRLCERAGIRDYGPMINLGMNLSQFVALK